MSAATSRNTWSACPRQSTTQDEERRKIERNLHDGAQQQLVALGVQLGLAHRLASQEAPDVAELLDRLRAQANDAFDFGTVARQSS